MTPDRAIHAPQGLGKQGRKLWKDVTKAYKLRLDELILLESASRTLDLIAQLDDAMDGQPLTVKGSMGQEREHPLLSEARQQRAQLNRTLALLKLPDLGTVEVNQHRAAAQSRWSWTHGGGTA